jgi:hypothetical protein
MRALLLALALLLLPACKPADPVQRAYATAIAPTGGRTPAANQIAADWRAKVITLDKCIDFGFELLDATRTGKPIRGKVPTSTDATAFAGAVLDATLILNQEVKTASEQEIFWQRLGGLAFAAAEEARFANRGPEAFTLVLAGNPRWQTESYWRLHSAHDGLASWLLAEGGRKAEALDRLRSRGDLDGFAQTTYDKILALP